MSSQPEPRGVIPGGEQEWVYHHMIPIAKLLIERGHLPIRKDSKHGFCPSPGGMVCRLARKLTEEDWAAINEQFVIPDNIVYFHGLIRDKHEPRGHDRLGRDRVP